CRPQYFAVTYSINPWMDPRAWADCSEVLHATAARQWADLHRTLLARDAVIEAIEPEPDLPDLVFTANAAVVLNRKAIDTVKTQGTNNARTPGAKRAGPGEYYFDMTKVNSIMGGPAYSSVFGGCVEGDRMIAALMG